VKKNDAVTRQRVGFPDPAQRPWRASVLRGILSVFLCVAVLPDALPAEQVDRILAAVSHEVITASDLRHAVALNMRLGSNREDRERIESETLEGLITGRLLVQEARRLQFVEISDQDISTEMDALVKRFGSDKALADFLAEQDMTAQKFSLMVFDRLLVERFVEKKVGLLVRVSRDEARSYFDEHAAEFQGRRFQDVQKTILGLLTERKIGQQLEQYVAELRGRADIRLNPR
jgi:hypothetical protein